MKKILLIIFIFVILILSSYIILGLEVTQEIIANVVYGEMRIYSPIEQKIYNTRMIPINITFSDIANFKYAKYSDNGDTLRTLCRNCEEYGFSRLKRKPFDDGYHKMKIVVIFEEGEEFDFVEFYVDSKKPRIRRVEPRRGFASGLFEIQFQEENPEELRINYGNDLSGWKNEEVDLNNCWEERRYTKCNVSVDLADFDGQEIEYWFNITDIAGNFDKSRKEKLDVDYTAPVINSFNFTINRRRVEFVFNITEINFDEIEYIDRAEEPRRQRWRRLCSRLDKEDRDSDTGTCERKRTFRLGEHNLTINILDEAGNSEIIEEVVFEIV